MTHLQTMIPQLVEMWIALACNGLFSLGQVNMS